MELGSNSPVIVMDDADIDKAVELSVSGAFWAVLFACQTASGTASMVQFSLNPSQMPSKQSRSSTWAGVMFNDFTDYRIDMMPFGGVKWSGLGREGIKFALLEMTEPKLACLNQ